MYIAVTILYVYFSLKQIMMAISLSKYYKYLSKVHLDKFAQNRYFYDDSTNNDCFNDPFNKL